MTAYIKSKTNDLQTPSPNRTEMFENKQRARRAVLNRKRSELSYYDPDDRNPFLSEYAFFKVKLKLKLFSITQIPMIVIYRKAVRSVHCSYRFVI